MALRLIFINVGGLINSYLYQYFEANPLWLVFLMPWTNSSNTTTDWEATPTGDYVRYDTTSDYDATTLLSSDPDYDYDGGYDDLDYWTEQSDISTTWENA